MLKIASRTLAAVGRVRAPLGAMSRRPRSCPPVSRIWERSYRAGRTAVKWRSVTVEADAPRPQAEPARTSRPSHDATRRRDAINRTVLHRPDRELIPMIDCPTGMSRVGAFFDVDRTIVSCNTARLFLRDLRRRGEISFFRALRALVWMAKYHLSLIDLQWVAARIADPDAGAGSSVTSPTAAATGSTRTCCRWSSPARARRSRSTAPRGTCWRSFRPRPPTSPSRWPRCWGSRR